MFVWLLILKLSWQFSGPDGWRQKSGDLGKGGEELETLYDTLLSLGGWPPISAFGFWVKKIFVNLGNNEKKKRISGLFLSKKTKFAFKR